MILLILPVIYGVRSDPKIEEFLKKPGVVEKLTAAGGQNTAKSDSQNSPLVKNAIRYSDIINPPPPPPPKAASGTPRQGPPQPPAPPVPVAVKFDLVATSYSASNPEKSFVLIDEAGKGLHWVKQGSTIGHVTIETVKDGAIVVRDGSRTSEMTVNVKENWRSLLKPTNATSTSPAPASSAEQVPTGHQGTNAIAPSPVGNRGSPVTPTRRTLRPGAAPSASQRITQPAPAVQPPSDVEITQPAEEDIQVSEDSPAIKEIQAKIDKLTAEMESATDEKEIQAKMNEVGKLLSQLETLNPPDANN